MSDVCCFCRNPLGGSYTYHWSRACHHECVPMDEKDRRLASANTRIAAIEAQLAEVRYHLTFMKAMDGTPEEFREIATKALSALEATPPAPKVTDVEFRLLEVGETLQSDDEVVDDNGKSWVPVDRWAVGTPYSRAFKSVRRTLTAAQEAGKS